VERREAIVAKTLTQGSAETTTSVAAVILAWFAENPELRLVLYGAIPGLLFAVTAWWFVKRPGSARRAAASQPPAPPLDTQVHPLVTATLIEDHDTLFLRVTNPGPPAHFRVRLRFEDTVELLRPKGLVYGVWNQAPSPDVEILSGESLDLLVANRRPYSKGHLVTGYYQWHFPYYDGADRKEIVTKGYFALNYTAEVWQDKWDRLPDDLEVALHLELLSKALAQPLAIMVNFKGAAWSDPDAAAANTGSREAVGRFRESYPIITKAVVYASDHALADLLMPAQANKEHRLSMGLIQACIVHPCVQAKEVLDHDLAASAPVASLTTDLQRLLSKYGLAVEYIRRGASVILGDEKYDRSQGYAGLYQRHMECMSELSRLARWPEFEALRASIDGLSQLQMRPPLVNSAAPESAPLALVQAKAASIKVEFIIDKDFGGAAPVSVDAEVATAVGLLIVHNTTAPAVKCRALVSVNSGIADWPSADVLACWYGHDSSHIEIESGSQAKIIVAFLFRTAYSYSWCVPYWQGEERHEAKTAKYFLHSQKPSARVHLSITIISVDRQITGGLPVHSVLIEGEEMSEV
jgi:hypothetical protein